MGHDYYDKDAIFKSYMKDLAFEEHLDLDPPIDEGILGHDIFDKVIQVHEEIAN
jgi:hypothetical protein